MLKQLNQFAGSLAGLFLYPLGKLIITAVSILVAFVFLAVGLIVTLSISFISTLIKSGFITAVLVVIILAPILSGVATIAFGFIVIAFSINGIVDALVAAYFGLDDGYEQGLFFGVFNHVWSDLIDNLSDVFSGSKTIFSGVIISLIERLDEEPSEQGSSARVLGELGGARNDVSQLHGEYQPLMELTRLTDEELRDAEQLRDRRIDGIAELNYSEVIRVHIAGYNSLIARLTKLDEAIAQRANPDEELNDQLISDELVALTAITNPVLFVKQYAYQPPQVSGQEPQAMVWRAVPSATYITDRETALQWFRTSARHPLQGDSISDPNSYMGHETRYQYTDYKGINFVQQLVESSSFIREELEKLPRLDGDSVLDHDEHGARSSSFSPQ